MSNLERDPDEVLLRDREPAPPELVEPELPEPELLTPRDVPLGGPRAMTVHRTLPQRARSLIGAWCFVDHYGPDSLDSLDPDHGMLVPPHPHTGLQTVSWLFRGEVEHRDSVGSHAMVRPGTLDIMTAGRGIQHSEYSTTGTTVLHGAQLWLALPDAERHRAPSFEATDAVPLRIDDAGVLLFLGTLGGARAAATAWTPTLGAQLDLPAEGRARLELDPSFEHGVLVDLGAPTVEGVPTPNRHLLYLPPGRSSVEIGAGDAPARVLLLGGAPFGERVVMWWNFVGRTHDEVVAFREAWQHEVIDGEDPAGRFGAIPADPRPPLPAPELPNARLQPRG